MNHLNIISKKLKIYLKPIFYINSIADLNFWPVMQRTMNMTNFSHLKIHRRKLGLVFGRKFDDTG